MDIIQEIEKKREEFSNIEDKIQQQQKLVNELFDELKRLQGEYRLLVRMGKEEGILDEQGNIINKE